MVKQHILDLVFEPLIIDSLNSKLVFWLLGIKGSNTILFSGFGDSRKQCVDQIQEIMKDLSCEICLGTKYYNHLEGIMFCPFEHTYFWPLGENNF